MPDLESEHPVSNKWEILAIPI